MRVCSVKVGLSPEMVASPEGLFVKTQLRVLVGIFDILSDAASTGRTGFQTDHSEYCDGTGGFLLVLVFKSEAAVVLESFCLVVGGRMRHGAFVLCHDEAPSCCFNTGPASIQVG